MTATTITPEKTGVPSPIHEVPRDEERAKGFYDRLRERIQRYAEEHGSLAGRSADFLLLVPDVFILLWRLVNDSRVDGRNKVLLGSGIAYYFFPLDVVPEMFLGPIGFIDDLVFGVYMLNKILSDTDPEILRQHWSGSEDVLEAIQRVLDAADKLVAGDLLEKIRKMGKG